MPHIEVTEELMTRLYESACEELIHRIKTERNGDDGGDYLNSAAEVFECMRWATWDQTDFEAVDKLLNTPPDHNDQSDIEHAFPIPRLGNLASEGICDAIAELNCPALQDEED